MTTKWDIVSRVENRVSTDLGSAVIVDFVEDAVRTIENGTDESIGLTSIGSSYVPAITDLATAYVMANKMDADIDIGVGGDISVNYRDLTQADTVLLEYYKTKAENSLKNLGKPIRFTKVIKSV